MQTIYGKIHNIDEDLRTLTLDIKHRRMVFYVQRSTFTRYLPYLQIGNTLVARYHTREQAKQHHRRYTVSDIVRIVKPSPRGGQELFSHRSVKNQTRAFINRIDHKLFLDLEMAMHPFYRQEDFTQEVIQAAYVLTDDTNRIVKTYKTFVQPTKHKKLTKRTLKFLEISQDDVDQGITFEAFYRHFLEIVDTYDPAVVTWGRNDAIAIAESAKINGLPALNGDARFVNLLNLHKNVFRLQNDLGLLRAYNLYGHIRENQRHDALEDAMMTMHIFNGFKAYLNDEQTIDTDAMPK